MLKNHQPPLDVDSQIENLISIGLIVADREYAASFLNDVSYFRLIKAFSLGLKHRNGNYHPEITFEQIVDLYKFNCDFRQLLFSIIERIEVNLRCRLGNYFSSQYGILGYENPDNFVNPAYHSELIEDIEQEIGRNPKSPFVKNFRDNYVDSKIPMYAVVELFSFGTLSKFFKNMKAPDKKAVAQKYGVGYTYFESWIENIAYVRNLCAHYGRLYNAKLSKTPILYKQYSEVGIGNQRIYATLLCIKHLVPLDDHWFHFVQNMKAIIAEHPFAKLNLMGFPGNWEYYLGNTEASDRS